VTQERNNFSPNFLFFPLLTNHEMSEVASTVAVASRFACWPSAPAPGERGETLAWLQRADSIGVNGVHAIVVAPVLIRLEMLRIERTYDLLITRHSLAGDARPRLEGSILFYGRRGRLEMYLWGNDVAFRGAVSPVFYTRGGERVVLPNDFQDAAARITSTVCCLGCRHCHLLGPNLIAKDQTEDHNAPDVSDERSASVDVVASGAA